ncbi:TPA: hypothetical protein ACW7ZX_003937 [Enterobacter roggenkampii]
MLNVVTLSVLPEACQKQKSPFYFFILLIINAFYLSRFSCIAVQLNISYPAISAIIFLDKYEEAEGGDRGAWHRDG